MTEHPDPRAAGGATPLDELLARADMWTEPPAGLEDAVVAAIGQSRAGAGLPDDLGARRSRRHGAWWFAAAAAVALVVAGVVLLTGEDGRLGGDVRIVLAGTDAAPGASAEVALSSTPAGLKILLDADNLEPAPDGFYYECWISNGDIRVSAGGFHLRRGHGPIELWAGVVDPSFDTLAVTLEPLDSDTDSSGDVRLRGHYELGD
jgi:hypothetical protein